MQCWSNDDDVGPTLYKCYTNVMCLLDSVAQTICFEVYSNGLLVLLVISLCLFMSQHMPFYQWHVSFLIHAIAVLFSIRQPLFYVSIRLQRFYSLGIKATYLPL